MSKLVRRRMLKLGKNMPRMYRVRIKNVMTMLTTSTYEAKVESAKNVLLPMLVMKR